MVFVLQKPSPAMLPGIRNSFQQFSKMPITQNSVDVAGGPLQSGALVDMKIRE